MEPTTTPETTQAWRLRLHQIIFESDTAAGRAFDIALLLSIAVSVVVVLLESTAEVRAVYGAELLLAEWLFTVLLSIEYLLRLISVRRPLGYVGSFFGVVDLLSIIPSYLSLLIPGVQYLHVIRVLRLLRIFRIFKLASYLAEAAPPRLVAEPPQDYGLLPDARDASGDHRRADVCGRGGGEWLHEHPDEHLLGDRDADHGRLWRHHAAHTAWQAARIVDHVARLRDHCGADRNRDDRDRAQRRANLGADLPGLQPRGAR